MQGVLERVPSVPFGAPPAPRAFLSPKRCARDSQTRPGKVRIPQLAPQVSYFFERNAVLYALGRGPSRKEKGLRNKDSMCLGVLPCSKRFSDSPSGAIITL